MKLNKSFIALCLVALVGAGLVLAGCGDTPAAGTTSQDSSARQQFLNDRSGTPNPNATPGATGNGRPPGVFGSVEKIDTNSKQITVKSQADGTETTVQLADGATINKQADAQASDLQAGVNVVATGSMSGTVLEASLVQIGVSNGDFFGFAGGGGGGGGFNGTPGAGRGRFNGTPGAGNGGGGGGRFFQGGNGTPGPRASGTPGPRGNFTAGMVAKVDGNTVTINMPNGSTGTFTISSSTRFQKMTSIQLSDLQVDDNIVANGQQNGNVFEANAIQVVTGTGFAIFGGGGGGGQGKQGGQAQETPTP